MATNINSDELSSIVGLSIGGEKFFTSRATLTQREPGSLLAALFSGIPPVCKDSEGFVFLDRDAKHFRHILNWLRDGVLPNLSDSSECSELVREAEYYQLLGLVGGLTEVLNKMRKDEGIGSEFTRTDIIKFSQSKDVKLRGVNLSGLDLSGLDLSGANFSYARLKNVSFSNAYLSHASFEMADLTNANFEGANLKAANLVGAILTNASLKNAKVQDAKLRYLNLRQTDLEGVDLKFADVCGAIMK